LTECHAQKLFPASKFSYLVITKVPVYNGLKRSG